MGAREAERPDRAASAADILDHKILAEMARKDICRDPAHHVGRPAGRERHDHRYCACRILLSLNAACAGEHRKCRCDP
jgi:hypothetical protein